MNEPFASTVFWRSQLPRNSMGGAMGLIGVGASVVIAAMVADYFVLGARGGLWLTMGFILGFGLIGLGYFQRWRN